LNSEERKWCGQGRLLAPDTDHGSRTESPHVLLDTMGKLEGTACTVFYRQGVFRSVATILWNPCSTGSACFSVLICFTSQKSRAS
jgi:hypothetical protein